MRAKSGLGMAAALVLFLGSACGRQPTRVSSFGLEPKYVTVPTAMAPLIPADAVGLLYLQSIDDAERSLRELHSGTAKDSTGIDLVGRISQRLAIPAESIDRTRPAALALSLYSLGRPIPVPTVIIPVHDEKQVLQALRSRPGRPQPLANKGYVGVPLLSGYELGTGIPPLAKHLPAGSIAVRLRMDRILTIVQPFIDKAIEKMSAAAERKGAGAEESAQLKAMQARTASAVAEQVLASLRDTETLECGLRTEGGKVALAYRMQAPSGSSNVAATAKRARGLAELSRCLPQDYPVMGLAAMDVARVIDFRQRIGSEIMQGSMEALSDSIRQDAQALMEHSLDLYRQADDQLFHAMRFTDSGAEVIQVFPTRDPEKFMQECRELLGSDLIESAGLGTVEWQVPEQFEGVRIEAVKVRPNVEKILELHHSTAAAEPGEGVSREEAERVLRGFFGGDAMVVRFAAVGDRVVVVTHPSRTVIEGCIARLEKGGRFPEGLEVARGLAKEPLCFWAQADLREILLPLFEIVHADTTDARNREMIRTLESMEPVRATAYMTAGRQAYAGACSVNLDPLRELSKALHRAGHHDHDRE